MLKGIVLSVYCVFNFNLIQSENTKRSDFSDHFWRGKYGVFHARSSARLLCDGANSLFLQIAARSDLIFATAVLEAKNYANKRIICHIC